MKKAQQQPREGGIIRLLSKTTAQPIKLSRIIRTFTSIILKDCVNQNVFLKESPYARRFVLEIKGGTYRWY